MMLKLINFVGFQAGWFACALTAARGQFLVGPAVVVGLLVLHGVLRRDRWQKELAMVAIIAPLGGFADTAITATGLVQLTGQEGANTLVLLWFVAFWANFAVTLNTSLAWLQGRPILGVVFGAVGGPPAYLAAEALGAIELDERRVLVVGVLGAYWAIAFPLAMIVARRLGGNETAAVTEETTPAGSGDAGAAR